MRGNNLNNLIKVAAIVAAHGIRGHVKIFSFIENHSFFLTSKTLLDSSGNKEFKIEFISQVKNSLIVSVNGINNRNQAELLKGTELFALVDEFPDTEEGEFYYRDLIGLKVLLTNNQEFGIIKNMSDYGAGDIAEIETTSGEIEVMPFDKKWVKEINAEKGYIIIEKPEYI
ncbi:MAG: ribosome maturation factor RimM [Rickettsiales bacterium]